MRKIFLILLVLAGMFSTAFSEENSKSFDWLKIRPDVSFEDFDWAQLPDEVTKDMVLTLLSSPNIVSEEPVTLLSYKNQIIALLPCKLDVLKWSEGEWINLYKGYSAGFNCKAYFFERDGVLFSYGKYGFWNAHSELIYFDFETGFWENLPAQNIPNFYAGVAAFNSENKLITFLGQYIQQSEGVHEFEKDGYYFDFEKNSWYPLKVEVPNQPEDHNWMMPNFELKKFGLHLYLYQAEMGFLVVDKGDLSLYFSKRDYSFMDEYLLCFSKENDLVVFDESNNWKRFDLGKELKSSFDKIGEIELLDTWPENSESKYNWGFTLLIILTIGVSGIIVGYYFRKNREEKEINGGTSNRNGQSNEEIQQTIDCLIPLVNQSLDVDQFDQVLGISTIDNPDYRKVRRSRLVKSVNQYCKEKYGKALIERTRSEQDKRIVLYLVLDLR